MSTMLRVRTVLTYGSGGPGLNTMYFAPGTPAGSNADAADVCARVRQFWFAIVTLLPITMTALTSGSVDAVESTTGDLVGQFSGGSPALVTGTGVGNQNPTASQAVLQLRTGTVVGSRLLRGRQFIGPLVVGTTAAGGGISSTARGTITTAANAMIALTPTLSFPVVWHRPGTTPGAAVGVTSYTVWDQFGSIRSRRDA